MQCFPSPKRSEFVSFRKLNTPAKVQDFLNSLPINFEPDGETCSSPRSVLARGTVHCFEGAVLAAAIFWYHGRPPFLLDLATTLSDESHVVALFKDGSRWGAVSKTNHATLRFRDPVYTSVRELTLSYFHEYFLDSGEKTLRAFSKQPLDLRAFEDEWLFADFPIWGVYDALVRAAHEPIASKTTLKCLRHADTIEITAGKLREWNA